MGVHGWRSLQGAAVPPGASKPGSCPAGVATHGLHPLPASGGASAPTARIRGDICTRCPRRGGQLHPCHCLPARSGVSHCVPGAPRGEPPCRSRVSPPALLAITRGREMVGVVVVFIRSTPGKAARLAGCLAGMVSALPSLPRALPIPLPSLGLMGESALPRGCNGPRSARWH